jgi:hypothetical protein
VSPSLNRRLRVVVALVVAVGLAVCVCSGIGGDALLGLAPALLLMATLFTRRYPGEQLLLGGTVREPTPVVRATDIRRPTGARTARLPRGGLLMGFALAVRPPPRLSAAS